MGAADIIILGVIVLAVFLIIGSRVRRHKRGEST